jgi:hypothetical protein
MAVDQDAEQISRWIYGMIFNGLSSSEVATMPIAERDRIARRVYETFQSNGFEVNTPGGVWKLLDAAEVIDPAADYRRFDTPTGQRTIYLGDGLGAPDGWIEIPETKIEENAR